MKEIFERLLHGEEGQDVAEYALLVAFVGVAALAAWLAMEDAIGDGYSGWDGVDQDMGINTPDPPLGG